MCARCWDVWMQMTRICPQEILAVETDIQINHPIYDVINANLMIWQRLIFFLIAILSTSN